MRRSPRQANGNRRLRAWLRRGHRWLGFAAICFVLLLSVTGIALNHSSAWGLDQRYVRWDWLTSALGIHAPAPSASFADRGHRVTQLGRRAYFDASEIADGVESLSGLVVLPPFAVIAASDKVLLLTVDGDIVQKIDLAAELPAPVARIGRADGRPVLDSGGRYFIGDADITAFEPWLAADDAVVAWSSASEPTPGEVETLEDLYRGRGLTVERLLLEIHSGRIIAGAGPLLLDVVALGLIVLGLSGLLVWLWGAGRGNGSQGRRR